MSKTKKSSSGSKGSSTTKKSTTSTAEINQVKQQLNTVKSSRLRMIAERAGKKIHARG